MKDKAKKYTVKICTDYVNEDSKAVQKILDRVADIMSASYRRQALER